MIGKPGRDRNVEIGDDDLHAVFVGVVEVLMDVLLANEVTVLA